MSETKTLVIHKTDVFNQDWIPNFKNTAKVDIDDELYDFLTDKIFPTYTNKYPAPKIIPDPHADFEVACDENKLELDEQNFVEDGHAWPRPKIGEIITEEQKQILQKYYDWHLNLVPQNWQKELQTLKDNQDKHTDYDTIKAERDKWTTAFPTTTPNDALIRYNAYATVKNERDTWTSLFPLPLTPQQIKDKLDAKSSGGTIAADEKVVKKTDWDELSKRPTKVDYNKVVDERNAWTSKFPTPLTPKQVDDIIKDFELNVPKLMRLIKAHTKN